MCIVPNGVVAPDEFQKDFLPDWICFVAQFHFNRGNMLLRLLTHLVPEQPVGTVLVLIFRWEPEVRIVALFLLCQETFSGGSDLALTFPTKPWRGSIAVLD